MKAPLEAVSEAAYQSVLCPPNDSNPSHMWNTLVPFPRFLKTSSHFSINSNTRISSNQAQNCRKLLGNNFLHTDPRIEFLRIYGPVKLKRSIVSSVTGKGYIVISLFFFSRFLTSILILCSTNSFNQQIFIRYWLNTPHLLHPILPVRNLSIRYSNITTWPTGLFSFSKRTPRVHFQWECSSRTWSEVWIGLTIEIIFHKG